MYYGNDVFSLYDSLVRLEEKGDKIHATECAQQLSDHIEEFGFQESRIDDTKTDWWLFVMFILLVIGVTLYNL